MYMSTFTGVRPGYVSSEVSEDQQFGLHMSATGEGKWDGSVRRCVLCSAAFNCAQDYHLDIDGKQFIARQKTADATIPNRLPAHIYCVK